MKNSEMFFGASASIFEKAKELRNNMTEAEKMLWKRLSNNKLKGHKFRRQHPIDCFIADFYCHKAKMIIELDGKIHDKSEQREYDSGREFELKELGLKILRFTNEEVLNDIDNVMAIISTSL